jgi:putative redox protein
MHAKWVNDRYAMDIRDEDGHILRMDIPVSQGGDGTGFRPMQTLLSALCGCSSVDVISILKKQRQEMDSLEIEVNGDREAGKEPSLWKHVEIKFKINGKVEPSKAWRAVDLSIKKYCSVAETLRLAGAIIDFSVILNGETVSSETP